MTVGVTVCNDVTNKIGATVATGRIGENGATVGLAATANCGVFSGAGISSGGAEPNNCDNTITLDKRLKDRRGAETQTSLNERC